MGRLASAPGRADVTLVFIQEACSINQGYTSRFSEHISKATVLLVSESGAGKKMTKGGKSSFCAFDLGMKGIIYSIHIPKIFFLDASSLEKYKCSTNSSIELPQRVEH
jgi:hypothetical protein